MSSQSEILPTDVENIKAKPLSSYLDSSITERLNLSEPIEPNQSGSSTVNLFGLAAGDQATNLLSSNEEQSSASLKGKKSKRLIIDDEEDEERGNHSQSRITPESLIEETKEESKSGSSFTAGSTEAQSTGTAATVDTKG